MMPKGFALVDIAEMDFHRRNLGARDRVSNRHTGVGVSTGIDHKTVLMLPRCVDGIDQDALVVALEC